MELNDFINNFADQFEDTDPAEITAETNFQELDEWDSLAVLSIIALANAFSEERIRPGMSCRIWCRI